jgi:hypothetical protein
MYTLTDCSEIVLGLLVFGKVPTAWSGIPFAVNERSLELQLHVAALV